MDKLIFKLFYSKVIFSLYFILLVVFVIGCAQNITGKTTLAELADELKEKGLNASVIERYPMKNGMVVEKTPL
jgi:pyruvate formate-lyase activating enzyme-like uncharacterized protein